MILLHYSCLERSDEKALSAAKTVKTSQPMTKSEYDRLSDSLVSWNKDICRRETGTIAGKGNPHYAAAAPPHSWHIYYTYLLYILLHASYFQLFTGIFAMKDLRESSVAAKYEGHLVSSDGTIQIRCTRTDILFSFRAELNREWTREPFSREHCASVMVTVTVFPFFSRFIHHNLQLYVGQTKQFEDWWNPPSGRLFCGFVAQSGRCTMGSTS